MRLLNKLFWLDAGLLALQPINGVLAWHWWQEGKEALFILSGAAFLIGLWSCRRLFDFMLTGFCMWWLKRKAMQAFAFMESMKEGLKDESNKTD